MNAAQGARTIEVFADVCCPFTHAGLRRFVERRAALGRDEVRLRVRAWPLELVNGAPLDAALIAEEVEELKRQVAPDLFKGFDELTFPSSSLLAMALAAAAYSVDAATGERVSLALRDAVFEQGRDVDDPAVVSTIAAAHGVPVPETDAADQVVADWREGRQRNVVGSPHFFVEDRGWFCPSLDIDRVDGRLQIRADKAAFDEILDEWLN